jgi:hypothetical protein
MRKKLAGIRLMLMAATAAGGVLVGNVSTAFADPGGCPNAHSAKGAAHANANSAHGIAKQLARGCVDQEA